MWPYLVLAFVVLFVSWFPMIVDLYVYLRRRTIARRVPPVRIGEGKESVASSTSDEGGESV